MYPIQVRNNIPYCGPLKEARYIIAHETANPTSVLMDGVLYMERTYQNAFVTHFVGDGGKIIQLSAPGQISWGAGAKANPYAYAQVELCRDRHDPVKFKKNYAAYCWLLRKLAKEANLPLVLDKGKGIVTHHWVTYNLGGTNHVDPYGFLQEMGISKAQFINDLTKPEDHPPLPPILDGWQEKDGHVYYYRNQKALTYWQYITGKWYYFNEKGQRQTGWLEEKKKWYYLDKEGKMLTGGVHYISDERYFFNPDGSLFKGNQWHALNWTYTKKNGACHIGWLHLNNQWYYLKKDGMLHTGWLYDKKEWYYLTPITGQMVRNQTIEQDGIPYTFDASGKLK